jgi:aspartate racemase
MTVPSKKIIAVIGGMGPAASLLFHEMLLRKSAQFKKIHSDQDYPNILHYSFANQITSRSQFLLGEEKENPANIVLTQLKTLDDMAQSQNWDVLAVIVCNTFHAPPIYNSLIHQLTEQGILRIKLLHIIKETVKYTALISRSEETIGILSTQGEWKEKVYKKELKRANLIGIHLPSTLQRTLHEIIFSPPNGIKIALTFSKEFFYVLSKIILNLKGRGANKIILGCTELSLIKEMFRHSDITFIDPLEIMSDLMVTWAYKSEL